MVTVLSLSCSMAGGKHRLLRYIMFIPMAVAVRKEASCDNGGEQL